MTTVYSKSGSASISLKISAMASTLTKKLITLDRMSIGCPASWKFCPFPSARKQRQSRFFPQGQSWWGAWRSAYKFALRSRSCRCGRRRIAAPWTCGKPQASSCSPARTPARWGRGWSACEDPYYQVLLDANDVPVPRVVLFLVERPHANGHQDVGLALGLFVHV